ncbi:hypothetical protein [Nostoc sp. CCY 9925]|uniref:hypothetical protein n=1 Tax=Nostoc sp. CCY 9925 TaxID=3103865 RepID=UPI0039C5C93A
MGQSSKAFISRLPGVEKLTHYSQVTASFSKKTEVLSKLSKKKELDTFVIQDGIDPNPNLQSPKIQSKSAVMTKLLIPRRRVGTENVKIK